MKISETNINGVYLIEPKFIGDNRGWFMESYRADKMRELNLVTDFVQDNHSFSATKDTVRGLHFQNFPRAQTKLVRCTRGAILDVVVDLRKHSPTYKKHIAVELTAENKKQLYIPRGCGHGFLTLENNSELQYKVDDYYSAKHDRSIRFDDAELGINWKTSEPVLSAKDKAAPLLNDSDYNFNSRVLVTGANGQLGRDMMKLLKNRGIECLGADIIDFDITNKRDTEKFIKNYKPNIIVHCAAYTAVDKAESERDVCYNINVTGTKNIAEAAAAIDAVLIYISSDYVYGGTGESALKEVCACNPSSYYGETKFLGEQAVLAACKKYFILRTSWVFGQYGNNFVKTMQRLHNEGKDISVICDQIGSPTYTVDLAAAISEIMFCGKFGVYNVSNEDFCSWADFAEAILNKPVKHIKSNEYKCAATRPLNSRMDKSKLNGVGITMPSWQNALERYKKEI